MRLDPKRSRPPRRIGGGSPMSLIPPIPSVPLRDIGYSCQTYLALCINNIFYNKVHYIWFSRELNPVPKNPPSCRPLVIYQRFDEAFKYNDPTDPQIENHKICLKAGLAYKRKQGVIDWKTERQLKKEINRLNLSWFRPKILELNLSGLQNRYTQPDPRWDAWLISDLNDQEYTSHIKEIVP